MRPPKGNGLWRDTPPAIFPPLLGMFAVGLGWRHAVQVFGAPPAIGEIILGAVALLYLFALVAYLAKFLRRPGVLADDLRIFPGRLGLSAASAAGMLLAAALSFYQPGLARLVLWVAVFAHAINAFVIIVVLAPQPVQQRRINGAWHLSFAGFIVAPVAAAPLGYPVFSEIVLILTLSVSLTIWLSSLWMMRASPVPPPLRPPLAIHLAPVCLFGIVAALLGYAGLALVFGWLSILGMAILLLRVRYLTAAGFSPMWGAFTFPLAAFANLMLLLAINGEPFRLLGGLGLIAATLINSYITFRVFRMWADRSLPARVNAARI